MLTVAEAELITAVLDSVGPEFVDESFKAQAAFIEDPSRRKFAFCTRRAGKSEGAARYLLKEAFEHPGSQVLYVGLTRGSAKAIMWEPILKRLARKWNMNIRWNEVELTGQLENGSLIRLTGADANDNERQKLLGQRNRLVVLDECASFRPHIRNLVWDVLRPTLIDELGTMAMVGTPGEVPSGYFFDVTQGKETGWSGHTWTTYENPYMAKQFAADIADLRRDDPEIESKPSFRRQYLGEWVTDEEQIIYKFDPSNVFANLDKRRWFFGLGIDLGWEDPTAFVFGAYSYEDPKLYILDSAKRSKMTFDEVNVMIEHYHALAREMGADYGLTHIVIDNANKQGVQDMTARYGHAFIPAEKSAKADFIGLMNSDLAQNKIMVHEDCVPLIKEWSELVWEKDRMPRREDPRCHNHLADAALYLWRHSKHYLGRSPSPVLNPSSAAWADQEAKKWEQEDFDQMEIDNNKEWWEPVHA